MIAGAILAAGSSSRFGPRPKQLAELDGRPLLEHAIGAMVAVTALERIVVVLGAAAEEIVTRLDFQRSEPLLAEDWEAGQAASLRCAVDELSTHAEAVVVTLGDQPRIAPRAIARVITAAARTEAARATYAGLPGHPVLLKKSLFGRIANLRGDVGARELLQAVAVSDTECSDLGPMIDVDTREELEELQRSLSR
jgi:CTP:molybdopterin cytidylyltransferase MocA